FFSRRRRHTRCTRDWSSDVCSSDLAEQTELALLIQELEAAEAGYLTPATERLRRERGVLEGQNRTLEGLALRKESLVRRLRDFLAEAGDERRAIESELAAVLAGTENSETNE